MLILAGERCALEFIYHDFHHLSPYPHTVPMMIRMRGNPKEGKSVQLYDMKVIFFESLITWYFTLN